MAELKLQNLFKTYNKDITAVKDFNLNIKDKEFIVLVGPSGCGKSTVLRLIAGLEEITAGNVIMNGKIVNDVLPKNRDIAFVFQNYALYPHMDVYNNLSFGLKCRKLSKDKIDKRVKNVAQLLNLEDYLQRRPRELSGGQQQRVALGRAIIKDAQLFLMDEPLSNLDAKLRTQMRSEIINLHRKLQTTTIYVTHDQTEALTMATTLIVMDKGEIQQVGAPREIYEQPANTFVGGFIGSPPMNFLTGTFLNGDVVIDKIQFKLQQNVIGSLLEQGYENKKIIVGIRPEDIHEDYLITSDVSTTVTCKVGMVELLGSEMFVHSELAQQRFIARFKVNSELEQNKCCDFIFDMSKVHLFDSETKERIKIEKCYSSKYKKNSLIV